MRQPVREKEKMDFLLASYGSDDDEAAQGVRSQQQQSSSSLSHALDAPSVKRPRFASLPPPRCSVLPLRDPILSTAAFESTASGGSGHTVPKISRDGAESASGASKLESHIEVSRNAFSQASSASSLFGSLPAPKTAIAAKRTVEFKPPVNISLLQSSENDEERVFRPKKSAAEQISVGRKGEMKSSGLAEILPAPKHSLGVGAVLGSGSGGRRYTMETLTQGFNNFSGTNHASGQKFESAVTSDSQFQDGFTTLESPEDTDAAANYPMYHSYAGNLTDASCDQTSWNSSTFTAEVQNGGYAYDYPPSNQIQSYGSSLEADPHSHDVGTGEDPIDLILKQERRKGREDCLPVVLQVKQDDLTASKIREDQLRTTGIAFGPSYKPVSSNKDKPSKLNRRKHQIGSLYFDMKQKEMELVERRAKGQLTKAETQAKYGW